MIDGWAAEGTGREQRGSGHDGGVMVMRCLRVEGTRAVLEMHGQISFFSDSLLCSILCSVSQLQFFESVFDYFSLFRRSFFFLDFSWQI